VIKLTKILCPEILTKNRLAWTNELKAAIAAGSDQVKYKTSKYNHPKIKEALKNETYKKCAYCESKLLHVTYGDIEHIIPKSLDPDLAFDWENLTLACDVCNTKKADIVGLIDPYRDDPAKEFDFKGPMIFCKEGRPAAELTDLTLDLNRGDLLERRRDRVKALNEFRTRLKSMQNSAQKTILLDAFHKFETQNEKEYAACAKAFLTS
jgi:uncharacterized protein (TIGR02646 family)